MAYNPIKSGASFDIREEVLTKCWDYLNQNFHKFSESNKIRVSLELVKKAMPTQIEGSMTVTHMPEIKKEDNPLRFNLGDLDPAGNITNSGQVITDNL